jgi:hypothetical protein
MVAISDFSGLMSSAWAMRRIVPTGKQPFREVWTPKIPDVACLHRSERIAARFCEEVQILDEITSTALHVGKTSKAAK